MTGPTLREIKVTCRIWFCISLGLVVVVSMKRKNPDTSLPPHDVVLLLKVVSF